jgi:hypothetical protein
VDLELGQVVFDRPLLLAGQVLRDRVDESPLLEHHLVFEAGRRALQLPHFPDSH